MKTNTAYQEKSKEELIALLAAKDQEINSLSEMLRLYRHRQFGNKSEKASADQINIFNEAELPKNIESIAEADAEIHISGYTRKSSGRKAFMI